MLLILRFILLTSPRFIAYQRDAKNYTDNSLKYNPADGGKGFTNFAAVLAHKNSNTKRV